MRSYRTPIRPTGTGEEVSLANPSPPQPRLELYLPLVLGRRRTPSTPTGPFSHRVIAPLSDSGSVQRTVYQCTSMTSCRLAAEGPLRLSQFGIQRFCRSAARPRWSRYRLSPTVAQPAQTTPCRSQPTRAHRDRLASQLAVTVAALQRSRGCLLPPHQLTVLCQARRMPCHVTRSCESTCTHASSLSVTTDVAIKAASPAIESFRKAHHHARHDH